MTIRTLRSQHAAAYSAWEATRSQKWKAEVDRLNLAIMRREVAMKSRDRASASSPKERITKLRTVEQARVRRSLPSPAASQRSA